MSKVAPGGPGGERCWRCGARFDETTPEVLARCHALAQAGQAAS